MKPRELELLIATKDGRRRLSIGIPISAKSGCNLTLLTPEGASMLVSQGFEVFIEKGLGQSIHYEDNRYASGGVQIVSRAETFSCDIVIYGGQLTPEEAGIMPPHSLLLTLATNRRTNLHAAQELLNRQITVIALDHVRDSRGKRPLHDILGEVDGRAAIAAATSFLTDACTGKGILLGGVAGVNPCEVVILGTGMAALAAARSSIGLGGVVRLFDSDLYCLRAAMSELGPAVIGSTLHPGVLMHALGSADVVIAAFDKDHFAIDGNVSTAMKDGVIIFDLYDHDGISGVFPTLRCIDVTTASEKRIAPSSSTCFINPILTVPRLAAMAITNDTVPIVSRIFTRGRGLVNTLKTDTGLRAGVMIYRGRVTNRAAAEQLGSKFVDINLLLSFS